LDDRLDRESAGEATPYEEVRDYFHFMDNYVHELDILAENLAHELGVGKGDNSRRLSDYLESKFGVRVDVGVDNEDVIRSYDQKTRVLSINPYAPAATRDFHKALQIAQLYAFEEIDAAVRKASFRSTEAAEICRAGLHNYFAGALLLPYGNFLNLAQQLRHDIELVAVRFGASLEQVCHRLSTLQRPGNKGVPIFFARIDRAGNITKRHSAAKFQFARFGAACPLWNAHEAFDHHERISRQLAETPDGVRYLCLATPISKGAGGYQTAKAEYVLALGCEVSYASLFVYADDLDLTRREAFKPIGVSCRICERTNCPSRAVPPIKRRLQVDHNVRRILPYELND
jgi:predicted transcriptional regulator